MNWYLKIAAQPVMCYGCNNTVKVTSSEWMSKRSDPANWRCERCRNMASGLKVAEQPEETPRDRGVASEHMMRMMRNKRI